MGAAGGASTAAIRISAIVVQSPATSVNLIAGSVADRPRNSCEGDWVLPDNRTWLVWEPRMLSVLRFVAGLAFLDHGTAKLLGFPPVAMFAHLHLASLLGVQGVIELVGGALVCIGLFTRAAAFILSGDMAVAYFMVHFPKSFFPAVNGGDAAILFCFIFFYVFVAGPGVWSLDRLLAPRSARLSTAARV